MLVWNTEKLVEVVQTTKLKHVDHNATFTCLYRRLIKRARHTPIANHLITSNTQYQHHYTTMTYAQKHPNHILSHYQRTSANNSSIVDSLFRTVWTMYPKIFKIYQMIGNFIVYNFGIIRFGIRDLQNIINILLTKWIF